MSRRRSRKQHGRQFDRRDDQGYVPAAQNQPDRGRREPRAGDPWAGIFLPEEVVPAVVVTTCGRCREFVEGADFGRGTCLHPASGVLSPWNDTPSCDYFRGRR